MWTTGSRPPAAWNKMFTYWFVEGYSGWRYCIYKRSNSNTIVILYYLQVQQRWRAGSETSVLLASTFTGMQHSVGGGFREHGQKERVCLSRGAETDRCRRRWTRAEDRWERWRNDKRHKEGRWQQTKSERRERAGKRKKAWQLERREALGRKKQRVLQTSQNGEKSSVYSSGSFHSIHDCVNVKSVAVCQSSSETNIIRSNREAAHFRKDAQANIRRPERDALEGARFKSVMLEMLLGSEPDRAEKFGETTRQQKPGEAERMRNTPLSIALLMRAALPRKCSQSAGFA